MMSIQPSQTLGEIAAQSAGAVGILEDHGIDYCCGGQRSFKEACLEKGLDWQLIGQEIEVAAQSRVPDQQDWNAAPLSRLIGHILAVHHAYLRRELPRLEERLARVQRAHPQDAQVLTPLAEAFRALYEELDGHMPKEEQILFPFIDRMETAATDHRPGIALPFGTFRNPIRVMEHEHDSAGRALAEIRRLTGNFSLPAHACDTYRALYVGLQELERDLHQHIHLENNILFPRALALEAQQTGR
jgi:regulator of cell morphogenesis and NO signaling